RLCACELRLPRRPPLFPYTPLFRSTVADGACRVERGADRRVDVTLVADPEALVAAAQARAAPWVGRLARTVDWIRGRARAEDTRSEEHTSELQSLAYLVCRLLLEKK